MGYYNWLQIVTNLSKDELSNIITNKSSEPDEKVSAAIGELRRRGYVTDEGAIDINKKVKAVPDENSPTLYSDRVIYTFSALFSVIFGGVLFAINLKTVNKKEGIVPVTIFSIFYAALSIYILNIVNLGTMGAILSGAIGAMIINNFFWKKYIGKDVLYHKKSFVKPLIIALIIFIPLFFLIIWSYKVTGQL
jgi:hypothetical protein